MSVDVGKAIGYLDLDTSGFKKGFKSALDDLNVFKDKAATASDKLLGLGNAMTSVGSSMTKNVTLPIVGAGTAIMAAGNKFEAQMSRVQGIAGATEEDLKALTDQAIDLGAKTSFSATEAALGMENLASAGFNTKEIMSAMPGLLDLAASSGADLAVASEIAASAVRGFGLEAKDTAHVADVFAEAAARTNAQTEDMGEAMKYIAPVANAMGQSLEMTAAAVGIMSDAGIKGSQAGTSLRGALSRLAKPTDAMTDKMNELGLTFYDAEGNMLPLTGIVEQLETGFEGLTQEQRNNALVTLFGQESLSGMLALMQRGPDELQAMTDSFVNCSGAAGDMADVMLDNTSGAIEEMMGSIETLAIKLQQVLASTVTSVVKSITDFVNKLSSADENMLKLVTNIALVLAAIGPVLLIVGKVTKGIGSIIHVVSTLKTTFLAVKGFMVAAGASLSSILIPIAAIIAAVLLLKVAWDNNLGGMQEKVAELWARLQEAFTAIIGVLQWFVELFSQMWESNWMGIQDYFNYVVDNIATVFNAVLDLILEIFDFFKNVFSGDWEAAWENIKNMFKIVWDAIFHILGNVLNMLVDTLIRVGVRLFEAGKQAFENIKKAFTDRWNAIKEWWSKACEDPIGTLLDLKDAFFDAGAKIFSSLWDGLRSIWDSIVGWVNDAIDWIKEKVAFWQSESAKVSTGNPRAGGGSFSHASGLDYVPYDGYPAILHEGEAVLTKQENKDGKRSSSGGDIFNFYSPESIDAVTAAREFKKVKQELAEGI